MTRHTIDWYTKKGYLCLLKDTIKVKAEDLMPSGRQSVKVVCDYCLEKGVHCCFERAISVFCKSHNIIQKDACEKCRMLKTKETNLIKYGVDSVTKLKEFKEKYKKTMLEKHGFEHYSQTADFKEKAKATLLKKYGVDNAFKSKEFQEKYKKTMLEKYGVENAFQSEEIKQKIKETNLEKYGVEHNSQTEENKTKFKNTCLEKYGVENPSQSLEVKEKKTKTNLKNWGVKNVFQNEEIIEKSKQTLFENGNCPTSKHQLWIFNTLKENNYAVELNYPLSNLNLDVALFIDNIKIDIEYDGFYWHKSRQNYDRRRDEFLKTEGWKILRIKSSKSIPTFEEIESSIKQLINTNRTYKEIVLSDWVERTKK